MVALRRGRGDVRPGLAGLNAFNNKGFVSSQHIYYLQEQANLPDPIVGYSLNSSEHGCLERERILIANRKWLVPVASCGHSWSKR